MKTFNLWVHAVQATAIIKIICGRDDHKILVWTLFLKNQFIGKFNPENPLNNNLSRATTRTKHTKANVSTQPIRHISIIKAAIWGSMIMISNLSEIVLIRLHHRPAIKKKTKNNHTLRSSTNKVSWRHKHTQQLVVENLTLKFHLSS